MKITVIGSSNTDMVVKASRLPRPGETILGHTFFLAAGGKGANQAVAAARAGGSVTFIAKVGDDQFGRQAIEGFNRDGIDTSQIMIDPQHPSGVAQILVDDHGENCIVVAPGANMHLGSKDIEPRWSHLASADIVLMQLESPLDTIQYVLDRAGRSRALFVLNPAPAQTLPDHIYQALFLITPNETEAALLTGCEVKTLEQVEIAGRVLLDKGVDHVLVTRGADGAILISQEGSHHIPGFEVQAVDTTGAGDVFNGSLCVALAEGKSLAEACRFANAAAALSVTRNGAQPSAPTREEILQLLIQ